MLAGVAVLVALRSGQVADDTQAGVAFPLAVIPFAHSGSTVLPALVTAMVGLAVLKAVGWGSSFIVGTATLAGVLAVGWSILSLIALAAPVCGGRVSSVSDPCSPAPVIDSVFATVALAVVCVAVAITIREMLPLSEDLRAREMRDRLAMLDSRQERVLRARSTGAYGRPYPRRLSLPLVALWYAAVVTVPIGLLLFSVAMVEALSPPVITVGLLLLVLAAMGAAMLHAFILVRFDGGRLRALPLSFFGIVGALMLAIAPLLMTALATSVALATEFALPAGLQWFWWLLVLASVLLPASYLDSESNGALPRVGLFGQVALSLEDRTIARLLRRQRSVDAARRRIARERRPTTTVR